MSSNRSRARAYCFTVNNPSEDEVLVPQSWDVASYNYLVYQLEEGAEGTRHLQGYVQFTNPKDFDTFCKWFPRRPHVEVAKGTAKQNRKYCTKSEGRIDGPWEFGVLPEAGKRNDLLAVKADLDAGASMSEIAENHFSQFVRYSKAFKEYKCLVAQRESHPKEIKCLWGSTGVGKTRWCFETYPGAYWKTRSVGSSQWWDGYDGHEVIVIDEFYGWFPWDFLLRLTDRYPLQLEVKGGTVPCLAKTIVFTSNKHPRDWYPNSRYAWDDSNPLKRRFAEVRELTGDPGSAVAGDPAMVPSIPNDPPSISSGGPLSDRPPVCGLDQPVFRNGLPAPVAVTDLYMNISDDDLGIGK